MNWQEKLTKIRDIISVFINCSYLEETNNRLTGQLSEEYRWWHTKLADYFENSSNMERRIEEYPYHLVKIKDKKRLEAFLCEWSTVDELYDMEFSRMLLHYWPEVCYKNDDAIIRT